MFKNLVARLRRLFLWEQPLEVYRLYQLMPEGLTPGQYFMLANGLSSQRRFDISDVDAVQEAFEFGWYKHVATFKLAPHKPGKLLDDLELIYQLTQNGVQHNSWSRMKEGRMNWTAPLVELKGIQYGHRSTTVGDVIETEDGTKFLRTTIGFRELKVDIEPH